MTPPVQKPEEDGKIQVTVNGLRYQVPKTYSEVSLNSYLREHLQLTGAKVNCREGGCGVCVVHAAYPDPTNTGQIIQRSINSCLCPILSCDGWEITTIEGIGDQKKPHAVQAAIHEHYGTQCGYCTPGMEMTMYSLLQSHSGSTLSKDIIEDSFGGNICRCTGYRPILDAFKSFANVGSECVVDLEDAARGHCKIEGGKKCEGLCSGKARPYVRPLPAAAADFAPPWSKPTSLADLYQTVKQLTGKNVYYVVGHTGKGVYDDGPYDAYVDLKGIKELYAVTPSDTKLVLGASVPLTDVIDVLERESGRPGFEYLRSLSAIIRKTAHISVRNVGSWGGNLAMKNRHKEFPSDSFTAFAMANAKITLGPTDTKIYSPEEFFVADLRGKVILQVELSPFKKEDYIFRTYKVMPRAQNAHGYVNAGFRAKIDKSKPGQFVISEKPALVYGNISKNFIHAADTESFLTGKNIADQAIFKQAVDILSKELKPEAFPAESSPDYRSSLATSLFYKFALEILGDSAGNRYRTAVGDLERPLSSGVQNFSTKKESYPLGQAIPKVESMIQCTGEAKYITDIHQDDILHAAFVLTSQANATIYRVDFSQATALPGVVRVFTASDIPGKNEIGSQNAPEELLASRQSIYAGQPVAIVVADTKEIAEAGAKLVKVEYSNVRDPILTCQDAIREKSFYPNPETINKGDAEGTVDKAPQHAYGEFEIGTQAHFHMETMVCVTYPTEDGVHMEAGTQSIAYTQDSASSVLGLGKHRINVFVKRNGGGFGAKGGRNSPISAATAVAAYILRRPVKMHQSLWDNMKMIGKRFPYYIKYRAGTDADGKLIAVIFDVYCNQGAIKVSQHMDGFKKWGDSGYNCPNWKMTLTACKTNRAPNTYTRAPGSTEAIFTIETVMEHLSYVLEKPSLQLKQLNFYKEGDKAFDGSNLTEVRLKNVTDQLVQMAEYNQRLEAAAQFNKANRWRKKGLGFIPMRYGVTWGGGGYDCLIAVFRKDSTVSVTHGGIELGQGINTKVAQVVAYELGIDAKYVVIQQTASYTSANNRITAGGISSELLCLSVIAACDLLKSNMKPVKDENPNDSWEQLVEKCSRKGLALTAHQWVQAKSREPTQYSVYGAMCTEVELDILTGEHQIRRVDLLYDCGESMSPYVDIGQVEGAIVMGMGYYTCEEVIYDKKTGENLTFGTWKYKPPGAKDIPADFRITLLPNAPCPAGVLRSKTTGEAPLCMSASIVHALRNAIRAQMEELGKGDEWVRLDAPLTVEKLQQYCGLNSLQLKFKD